MKFVMVQKGYRYETTDGKIALEKGWRRVCTVRTVHGCMDKYEEVSYWMVYGIGSALYEFHLLRDAKAFVEKKLTEELAELQGEYDLFDESTTNKERGARIRELRNVLGLTCKPRASRRPPRVINK